MPITFSPVLVVGMHFRKDVNAKALVSNMVPPLTLDLEREPLNPYDPFAVKVFYRGDHIGYIERGQACFLAPEMDSGKQFICTVESLREVKGNLHPVCTIAESS